MTESRAGRTTADDHPAHIARGAAWSSLGRLSTQVIQFGASLVLARLLLPEQFGLIAAVQVFSQFAVLFFELGMGAALVQAKDLREEDLSTVFWINALGGLVFAGLIAACGPAIAAFFDEPQLKSLAPIVALSFTANLAVCHLALLQRAMRFRPIAIAEVTAALAGFTTSILGAIAGLGVYALAVGPVVQQIVNSIILASVTRWRPTQFVSKSSALRVWGFSRGLLGFNVVNYWGRNADNLIVGRFSGAADLGYYNRAYNFMLLPVQQVSQVLGRVMLPALSRLQDDHAQAGLTYRRALQAANLLSAPVLAGVAVTAPGLVPLLWGERWAPMVPLLILLCIAGIPQCLTTSVGWIYQSQNRNGALFKMGLVTSSIGVVAMAVGGVVAGATGVAVAVVLRSWVLSVPTLAYAGRIIGLKVTDVLRDNAGPAAACIGMVLSVWFAPEVLGLRRTSVSTLGLQVLLGLLVYGLGIALVARRSTRAVLTFFRRGPAADAN